MLGISEICNIRWLLIFSTVYIIAVSCIAFIFLKKS